ncbi:tRNA lysidine(34) synthetase TilS, partial [Chloroflexota bacterium]
DNIETILMHLIRGAGTRGLCGLQPLSQWQSSAHNINVIRPLLTVSRQETTDYCCSNKLAPRFDTSNLSMSPLRNRIRHQLLPLLRNYNPRVADALLRTARIAVDELSFLDDEVARLWPEAVNSQEGIIAIDKERFGSLPAALQRHLLRAVIERLLGDIKGIEALHIEDMMAALSKPAGKRISLPRGLVFSVEYDRYLIGNDPVGLSPLPVLDSELPLKVPGETILAGWRVETTIISWEQMAGKEDDLVACLDMDKTGAKLSIRPRRPGDRFQPLGMSRSKKLGEFMIDARIPQAWRERIPIICSPRRILWVVGWRIDNRVKVTDATRKVLCLKMVRR